jgi:uncharacterized protein (DUF2062 family)
MAYRVGTTLLGISPESFRFTPSLEWFQNSLQPVWKPFLLGCVACAVVTGLLGWLLLELIWRWNVTSRRYRGRREAPAA